MSYDTDTATDTANDFDYILAAYTNEGELVGYLTERSTITNVKAKAVRYYIGSLAQGRAAGLMGLPGYCAYLWAAEFVPKRAFAVPDRERLHP